MQKRTPDSFRNLGFITLAMSYSRTTYRSTTIGAAAFHFRVRNGNGWDHCARITRKLAKSKLARGGMGAVSPSTSPENLTTKVIKMWLGAADQHGSAEANHSNSTPETPRAPSTPGTISRNRICVLPESGHYQLRCCSLFKRTQRVL